MVAGREAAGHEVGRLVVPGLAHGTSQMKPSKTLRRPTSAAAVYEIVVDAALRAGWARMFEGFALVVLDDGTTRLVGSVADQAALFGILGRIRDLNAPLLSVRRIEPRSTGE